MKFFFPDSQDMVNPNFNFESEKYPANRVRQHDDVYAHEVFAHPPCDGLLVSKAIVDGVEGAGKYTLTQRLRLRRQGVRGFFRLQGAAQDLAVIGDCGAFSYVKLQEPPPEFAIDEVLSFYDECQVDFGVSVDHVILGYQPIWDAQPSLVPPEIRFRQELTLSLAEEFLSKVRKDGHAFEPMGVAQGWSPDSYRHSVEQLVKMGYRYIALGGMVPLKTPEIIKCLEEISASPHVKGDTQFHLLGVTRIEHVETFAKYRVVSFDSTSPLMMAFKDDRQNYFAENGHFTAIRIPQHDANPGISRRIKMGQLSQDRARVLERACLSAMKEFDAGKRSVEATVAVLGEYEALNDPKRVDKHLDRYRHTLQHAPWKDCPCEVCRQLGYHVIVFRGSERNRRRGFHNLAVFYRQLQKNLMGGAIDALPELSL